MTKPRQPTKACDAVLEKIKYPCAIMPKIDGVRAVTTGVPGALHGRTLKRHRNVYLNAIFGQTMCAFLDMELTQGGDPADPHQLCNRTTSVVNSAVHPLETTVHAWVFDVYSPHFDHLPYEQRYALAGQAVKFIKQHLPDLQIALVPMVICENEEQLLAQEEIWLAEGYEGVIGRSLDGVYKSGRCTVREGYYWRIKRFEEEDAIITGFEEAMENTNEATINELGLSERSTHQENMVPKGMVGAILAKKVKTGEPIKVGPGEMDHDERKRVWESRVDYIGRQFVYKHFPKSVKDKPRFPTFVVFRMDSDTVSD